jgi:hypothetical protein
MHVPLGFSVFPAGTTPDQSIARAPTGNDALRQGQGKDLHRPGRRTIFRIEALLL